MPTTIESLELEVQSNASSAEKGIDALSASLSKLKNAVKGGVGLTSVTNQLKNLNSAVQSLDGNAASKIDKLTTSLAKLSSLGKIKLSSPVGNQLKNIGNAAAILNGTDFSGMDRLTTSLRGLNSLTKATGLSSALNQLKKIPEITKALDSKVIADFTARIKQLSDALQPLVAQLNTVGGAFARLPVQVRRVISSTNALNNVNCSASTGYLNLWAKARMAYNAVRAGARTIASWITESNSYIENLNLFTASLGNYAGEAKKYAEQVGEIMGIDPGEFMRHQGIFMTLTEGFGVASDRAYIMSKNLTQLGYDLSSFFNISFADSMQKLASGISGELEPLRRLGYDLSEAKLKAVALSLGIDKSFNSMTQAEKAQLRYYTIMKQVTVAQGDMARTLNAPANQLRILQAQVTQCTRALGNIFIPMLNAVLPYAIALAKVIRLLANSIASLFGFALPEIDYSSIAKGSGAVGDLAGNADDAAGGLGNAAKKAKEVKNALLGIDELNIISPLEDATGGDLGNLADFGGDSLDFELPEYDFLDGAVATKVEEIVQKMKEWLGLTEEINSWGDFFHTKLGKILTTIGAIGLGLAGWKIAKSVLSGMKYLTQLKNLGLDNPLTLSIGISLAITGITLETAGIIDAIKNELDGLNFAQILGGGAFITAGGAFIGKAVAGWITSAFSGSTVATALSTAATNLGLGTATAAGSALGAAAGGIIAGIPAFITGIYDSIVHGIDWLSAALTGVGATAAGAGIGAIIGACGGPIGAGIGALIGLIVGALTDIGILIYQKWDEISAWFSDLWENIKSVWESTSQWFKANVIDPLSNFFSGLWEDVSNWSSEVWESIKGVFSVVSGWFRSTVIDPISGFFSSLWAGFCSKASDAWQSVKSVFSDVGEFFGRTFENAWKKVVDVFSVAGEIFVNIKDGVVTAFKKIVNAIIRGINSVIAVPFNAINYALRKIRDVSILGLQPFSGIRTISIPQIPLLANGGFFGRNGRRGSWDSNSKSTNGLSGLHGSMFIAGENGAEMVGHIHGQTEVLNQSQIKMAMRSAVISGMAQFTSYWRMIHTQIAVCTNAIIRSVLVSSNMMAAQVGNNDNQLVQTITVGADEIEQSMVLIETFDDLDSLEIEFTRTAKPYSRIVLNHFNLTDVVNFTMTRKDMITSPKAIKQELIKDVIVPYYSYQKSNKEENLVNEEITVTAGQEVTYYIQDASYGYRALLNGKAG